MTNITPPSDLQAWAEVEVAGGRAESLDALITHALELRKRELERLRALIDEGRRSEALNGDAFLAELDRWIAEDEAAAT